MTADVIRVMDVCHGLETLGLGSPVMEHGRGLGCCKAGTQQPSWKMVIWQVECVEGRKTSVSVVGADAIVKVRLPFFPLS